MTPPLQTFQKGVGPQFKSGRAHHFLANCQKPPIREEWHAGSIADIIQVVFEHARKYTFFQNIIVDFVHWLETNGIFPTYKSFHNPISMRW